MCANADNTSTLTAGSCRCGRPVHRLHGHRRLPPRRHQRHRQPAPLGRAQRADPFTDSGKAPSRPVDDRFASYDISVEAVGDSLGHIILRPVIEGVSIGAAGCAPPINVGRAIFSGAPFNQAGVVPARRTPDPYRADCPRTELSGRVPRGYDAQQATPPSGDEDFGSSPLSIIEIPHLRTAAGCC